MGDDEFTAPPFQSRARITAPPPPGARLAALIWIVALLLSYALVLLAALALLRAFWS